MTLGPMWAVTGGGLGFWPNGRAEGYVACLSSAARLGSFDGGSVGLVSGILTPMDSRPGGPPWYAVRRSQGVPHFHSGEKFSG